MDKPTYTHPDGYEVPRVTLIVGQLDLPFLRQWAANEAAKFMLDDNTTKGETIEELRDNIYNEARYHYKDLSKQAMDFGSCLHHILEDWCRVSKTPMWGPIEAIWGVKLTELLTDWFDLFILWSNKHNLVPIEIEKTVFADDYAGTMDLICEIDSFWMTPGWCKKNKVEYYKGIRKQRVVTLIDFKTGKGSYYETWGYQIAAYKAAYNDQRCGHYGTGACTENGCITCPDGNNQKLAPHHGVLKFDKDTGRINYKDFSPTYDRDWQVFKHLLGIFKLTNSMYGKDKK